MSGSEPNISVVIPTYNRARFISDTIHSVLRQTYTAHEVIVVDDGSTDDTEAVVGRITDPRVRYIWQENKKSAGAYNTGLRAARGQYIVTLDSDDLIDPSLLEKQMGRVVADPGVGFIAVGRSFVDQHGHPLGKEWTPWLWGHSLSLEDWLQKGCPMNHTGNLIRRDWLERLGFLDETAPLNEDYDLYLRLAHAGCKMVWLEEVLAHYRLHDSNLIHDARAMRDGHRWVLHKFFADASLPSEIRGMEADVLTRQHLQSSGWAYACKDHQTAHEELRQAITISPHLLEDEHAAMISALTDVCFHPVVDDPFEFLSSVAHTLPIEAQRLAPRIEARRKKLKFMQLREQGRTLNPCRQSA